MNRLGSFMERVDLGLCPERHLRLKYTKKTEESILFGKQEKDITVYRAFLLL